MKLKIVLSLWWLYAYSHASTHIHSVSVFTHTNCCYLGFLHVTPEAILSSLFFFFLHNSSWSLIFQFHLFSMYSGLNTTISWSSSLASHPQTPLLAQTLTSNVGSLQWFLSHVIQFHVSGLSYFKQIILFLNKPPVVPRSPRIQLLPPANEDLRSLASTSSLTAPPSLTELQSCWSPGDGCWAGPGSYLLCKNGMEFLGLPEEDRPGHVRGYCSPAQENPGHPGWVQVTVPPTPTLREDV